MGALGGIAGILVREVLGSHREDYTVRIFATDLDSEAFAFARKLTVAPQLVVDEDVAALRWHYTDHEVAELVFHIANAAFFNRVTEAARLLPLPEGMDFVAASAFVLTYGTSDHALRDRGALKAGETLLVLGAAGGVGLAAIEIGKALGARVIACASSDEKLAVCRDHGADAGINYATEDLRGRIKALTEDRGVDVVYDAVGGPYSEPAFRSLAWRGRHLVVGFAAGEIPKLPLNLALLKGASVVGVFWGDFVRREPARFAESIKQLTTWYREGKLKPHVSQTLPLEKAAEALKLSGRM
jgi:NADPH2:quinone reductase